jgi:predicted AAA+ superfamily ATPase
MAGNKGNAQSAAPADDLQQLMQRANRVLQQLEHWLPATPPPVNWEAPAYRWRKSSGRGYLHAVLRPHAIRPQDLIGVDRQRKLVEQNTRQFVAGRSANNVLLTGARGTGKSSLVKAMLVEFGHRGLRLIEVDKSDLTDLPEIVDCVASRPERYIVFCDDLSFDADESGYKALKVALDGSIEAASENLLIYATSNRRHLMPEYMQENLETKHLGEEIHPGEAVEEKVSLSERFGLWVSFYPFDQDEYLAITNHWLSVFGCAAGDIELARQEAIQWALQRGSRSGRVAWQFARDWSGRKPVAKGDEPTAKSRASTSKSSRSASQPKSQSKFQPK